MSVLGVDVGSTRMHVAIAHDGQALSVPALDGAPYVPAVIARIHGKLVVGENARPHFFVAPDEVLWSPARHLGAGPVRLGGEAVEPVVLMAALLEHAAAAGQAAARTPIEGVALSRAAWASAEAQLALVDAAHSAGLHLVRTEVPSTLAAVARRCERPDDGLVVVIDVGGWKVEATVLAFEPGSVRALGRSVDPTIGGNWLDGQLVRALVRQIAPDRERDLIADKLCYALLREQCEATRMELSSAERADVDLPFLAQVLGLKSPPAWRLDRAYVEAMAGPLLDAVRDVCGEALEQAQVGIDQVHEAFLTGGLAHMPALRNALKVLLGRPITCRGDVDGMAARGAALVAAASLGQTKLRLVDDLDDRARAVPAAGWGLPVPAVGTPGPESTPAPRPRRASVGEPASVQPAPTLSPHVRRPSQADPAAPTPPAPPPATAAPAASAACSTASPPAAPRTPGPEAGAHAGPAAEGGLPAEGPLKNAATPAALAAVPLEGALPLAPPLSLPVLLLLVGRRRQLSGHLHLERDHQQVAIAVVRGGAAGNSLEMEQLRRAFEWPEGRYRIDNEAPAARLHALRKPMVGVVVHGIRSWLRLMDVEAVLAVLAPQLREAPVVRPSRAALLPLLGLSPREARFVEHVLDGSTSGDEILRRGGIGRETAIQLMFVLHLLRALDWRTVEGRAGETPAERLRQRARKLEKADHFEALGVHWSAPRSELDRALRHLEDELKPGGRTSQIDPEATAQILARVQRAYQSVARAADRHAYLLTIHPDIDFEAIESVTEDQSQWYAWRGATDATEETARLKHELVELSRMQHEPHKGPAGR